MVSKCADPACSARFHYLREGKVFQLQISRGAAEPQLMRPRPSARVEHFWLCGPCAEVMTLLVDDGKVVAVPRAHIQYRRAAAS